MFTIKDEDYEIPFRFFPDIKVNYHVLKPGELPFLDVNLDERTVIAKERKEYFDDVECIIETTKVLVPTFLTHAIINVGDDKIKKIQQKKLNESLLENAKSILKHLVKEAYFYNFSNVQISRNLLEYENSFWVGGMHYHLNYDGNFDIFVRGIGSQDLNEISYLEYGFAFKEIEKVKIR